MSDQTSSKNDLDLEETTSWEVISEENISGSSSIENIAIDEINEAEPTKNDLEHIFVDIPEEKAEPERKTEEAGSFPKKLKSKAKKKVDNFTAVSIAASLFTITGLTLLCCLFPSETDKASLEVIKDDYFEIIKGNTENLRDVFNKTAVILNTVHNSTDYYNATNASDDLEDVDDGDDCPAEDASKEKVFNGYFDEKIGLEASTSSGRYSFKDLRKSTSNLISGIRAACLNPSVRVFLYSLMQDVCLIKLIQHLERKRVIQKTPKRSANKKFQPLKLNKVRIERKNKKVKQGPRKLSESTVEVQKEIENNLRTENGKSECERRFEELENKWEYLGKNHRQKMHDIKEEFKSEIVQMKGREKEFSLRKQKMKSIRDKYVQKLKADRQRYLLQLKKIKDERQKVMHEICRRKKVETQPKDASVGNYGLLVTEVDFQAKLNNLNKENKEAPTLQFEDYSKFWKNLTVPKIPKDNETSSKDKNNNFVLKLRNFTESLEDDNLRDRSEIYLSSKKITKVPRRILKKSKKEENMTLPDPSRSFLPTITRIPSKMKKLNETVATASSAKQQKSFSFTTTALQSPSAIRFPPKKNIEAFNTSSLPKIDQEDENLSSFSINKLMEKEKLKSAKSDIAPFNRGFNENYSFIPIRPKNLLVEKDSFAASKNASVTLRNILKKSLDVKKSLASKSEIIPSGATRSKDEAEIEKNYFPASKSASITLRNILKKSREASNVKQSSVASKSEIIPLTEDKIETNGASNSNNGSPNKQDLYQLLFDIDGERIKRKEKEMLENPHKRFASPPPLQIVSKQDPKLPKKVYLFKGRL